MQATFRSSQRIRVSQFDQVNAWLIAAIVVFSVALLVLATIMMRDQAPQRSIVGPTPFPGFPLVDSLESVELDPELDTPELVSEVVNPSMFEQVSESVSVVQAGMLGEKSSLGSLGDGKRQRQVLPEETHPSQRWKIAYELDEFERYTQQIRFFKIEIGVVSQTQNEISRIKDVGRANKVILTDRGSESKSVYFVSEDRRSRRWDRKLIDDAKLTSDDSIIVHFYPQATLDLLAAAESKSIPAAKHVDDIAKTSFKLTRNGDEYEFEVVSIEFK